MAASSIAVGLNGFGRIGKLAMRISEQNGGMHVVAVNDPYMTPEDMVYALKYDSTHGRFDGSAEVGEDGKSIVVNGRVVTVTMLKDPAEAAWGERGVGLVIDCSGVFTTVESAGAHLRAGAQKVLISAPSADAPMTVLGVNSESFDKSATIISNASCTTNCLAPLVKVVHEAFGIEEAIATTVHACTASQRIVDLNNHKKHRLGRSGMTNIIPSTTGAAAAVSKVFPALEGRITGMAMRVPVADVSVVDVTCRLSNPASLDDIKAAMDAAAAGPMAGILEVTTEDLVSSDCIGNPHSCIYDATASIGLTPTFVKLIAFYDNEFGYANRLCELAILAMS